MPATAWFETDADSTEEVVIAGSGDETGGPSSGSMGAEETPNPTKHRGSSAHKQRCMETHTAI